MAKLTVFSAVVLAVLLATVLAFGALGLAVREGLASEVLFWFPPSGKYQLIVRVGPDALPWQGRSGGSTTINVWVHGRGADWHVVRLLGVPFGTSPQAARRP